MDNQDVLETVGAEAFSLLAQFFEYDRNAPLDARASDREESDYYVSRLKRGASAKEHLAPVAPRNFAPAITQAAFLMMNGRNDTWGTEKGVRALHELVRSPTKELIFFDSGHRLPSEFVSKAVEWFRRHLTSEPITAA